MSRLVEIEMQTTINNIQVIDRTVNIVDDSGKSIIEYFELVINGKDNVRSDKTFNALRHEKNKRSVLKNLRKV
jgi:hypothetical protein